MSKTPYELRFEIFKQAYNMLCDDYHAAYAMTEALNDKKIPEDNNLRYPRMEDVLYYADIINNFVSDSK